MFILYLFLANLPKIIFPTIVNNANAKAMKIRYFET